VDRCCASCRAGASLGHLSQTISSLSPYSSLACNSGALEGILGLFSHVGLFLLRLHDRRFRPVADALQPTLRPRQFAVFAVALLAVQLCFCNRLLDLRPRQPFLDVPHPKRLVCGRPCPENRQNPREVGPLRQPRRRLPQCHLQLFPQAPRLTHFVECGSSAAAFLTHKHTAVTCRNSRSKLQSLTQLCLPSGALATCCPSGQPVSWLSRARASVIL